MRTSSAVHQNRAATSSSSSSSSSSIQLTPLWEHILRTRKLPDSTCPRLMFAEFLERLKDPEWQVRQHALRVFVDVLVVMKAKADPFMQPLIGQLVENLGHQAPTVRKGALDCLRVYLSETAIPEVVILQILDIGLNQKITNEPFGGRLTCGVMLSLPALVQSTLHTPKRHFIIRTTIDMLIQKMGQVTHQEITLKVLRKMRELLGEAEFVSYMSHGAFREFDLLCNVYGLNEQEESLSSAGSQSKFLASTQDNINTWRLMANSKPSRLANCWHPQNHENDEVQVVVEEAVGSAEPLLACPAKVIMETEIKINDDTLTMRILEAKDDDVCLVEPAAEVCHKSRSETFPNSLEDEVVCGRLASAKSLHDASSASLVKLLSDSDDTEDGQGRNSYYTLVTPSTPSRTPKRVTFGGEVVKMRTPDSDANSATNQQHPASSMAIGGGTTRVTDNQLQPPFILHSPPSSDVDSSKTTILTLDIPNDNTKPLSQQQQQGYSKSTPTTPEKIRPSSAKTSSPASSSYSPSPKSPQKSPGKSPTSPKSSFKRLSISPVDSIISPRTAHKAIEVMHNLQRDPSPNRALTARRASLKAEEANTPSPIGEDEDKHEWITRHKLPTQNQTPAGIVTQPPPPRSWEELGIVDETTILQLRSGNWRHRLQGVIQLEQSLRSSDNLARVQPCLDSLLRTLLSSECKADVAEEKRKLLINLITRLPLDNLEDRTMQIMSGLCRQGGAGANRVCKALMQRLPPSAIILKLISQDFLHAKSSRFREHALQMVIYALMTFPSTCFDTATCVTNATYAALNRKRRVRQAALDVLAVLGQISSAREVLDVVQQIASSRDDGAALVAAVKARLSRKQLPLVGSDGSVQYSLHVPPTQLAAANISDSVANESSSALEDFRTTKASDNVNANAATEGNGQQGPDIDWITAGIGSVSPSSLKRRAHRTRVSTQQSFRCLKTGSNSDDPLYRQSFRKPSEISIHSKIFENDDNTGYNFHHVFASNPYNYGLSSKKSNVDYPVYTTRRIIPNSCSDSSVDGRSSDSNYTSSGGSVVSNDVPGKGGGGGGGIGGGGGVGATVAGGSDGISGRFTRQTINSRFPAMDMNGTYRVHKPPTYYPGMGAYAHLQQQQYNMNATYPKVNYNLNGHHYQTATRRKSQHNNFPMHPHQQQQQQQQSPPYYYINNNINRAQHFNHHNNQQKNNNFNNNGSSSNNNNTNNCGNQETFKKLENLQTKDSNNCNDNLDGTYTICMGSKLSATLHQQHQQMTAAATAAAANGRRFVNVDKILTASTKSSQSPTDDNENENNNSTPQKMEEEQQSNNQNDIERLSQKTPSGSVKSGSYSLKSTASAQSSTGSRSLKNDTPERTAATTEADVQSLKEGREEEDIDGKVTPILTTPLTTVEATVSGTPDDKDVNSESVGKWRTGEEVLQLEDVVDTHGPQTAVEEEENEDKNENLQRNGSLVSLHSKTESIKTLIGDTPPLLSRAQSAKSLAIEEDIEDNTSFVVVEDTADEDEVDKNPDPVIEETTDDSEVMSNNTAIVSGSKPNSGGISRPQTSRSRSPTIEEIKALSRRNSMIKSMESLYERPASKHEFNDNTTETSSQSSAQLNSSLGSTIIPVTGAIIKPQHTPLKQKSKTTHFLKSHRRISPVKQSIKVVQAELYPPTLQRFEKPREAIMKTFDQLDSSNWEVIMVGLKNMVRLMRYHPDNLDNQMHMVCIQLSRTVRNLRSQVARAACQAATELFTIKSRILEQECDDLVCALLHRTADTNRFIRADATRALEAMCDNLSPGKILNILTSRGAQHQNALVRTTTAKLLNRLAERLGLDKIYTMPRDHREKFFITCANLLLEGSLETRSYAKTLFRMLSEHGHYQRMLLEIIPPRTYRNIEKTLKSIR
ncbi:uncharacterized protein LOC101891275 [Musca domestica]|uniref:Uncharacterized protein LOC101891275 n=1 Tax=Musca domestica TaxID=7370 RepID=A0A1I8N280_MUSDO|nr:uncharacterized protein LOC101891275 [Musca domestica]